MFNIALDCMGGDFAPKVVILGALKALKKYHDIHITLYGDEEQIAKYLKAKVERLDIVHTPIFLDMGSKDPVSDFKTKRKASMFLAMDSVVDGTNQVVVSAGPTQCLVVASHLIIKRLPEAKRIAICPIIPSFDGRGRLLLDSGANIDSKPEHIVDFALYASIASSKLFNIAKPKVGLVNIGTEPGKGREFDKQTFELLSKDERINFIGNIEPKDVLDTEADILVNDGFTINIVLKTLEGTAKTVGRMLSRSIKSNVLSLLGAVFMNRQLKEFKSNLDASKIGGALLLGLKSTVIKAHGSSNEEAIFNAIRQARDSVKSDIVKEIAESLSLSNSNTVINED